MLARNAVSNPSGLFHVFPASPKTIPVLPSLSAAIHAAAAALLPAALAAPGKDFPPTHPPKTIAVTPSEYTVSREKGAAVYFYDPEIRFDSPGLDPPPRCLSKN